LSSSNVLNFILSKPWTKNYDEGVPSEINIPEKPLYSSIDEAANTYPEKTAIIFFDKKITYKQLKEMIDRFAHALQEHGVKKGDVVAIMLPNTPQFVISYYAILKIGGIVTPLNPLYKSAEIKRQLLDSGAETIILLDLLYPEFEIIKNEVKMKNIIVTSIKDFLPPLLKMLYPLKYKTPKIKYEPNMHKFMDLLKYSPEYKPVNINPKEDPAALMYTGGTTGIPKGAMLTHYNLLSNAVQIKYWFKPRIEPMVVLSVLPFFHIYGQTAAMNYVFVHMATMVILPRFDVKDMFKSINKYRVTVFHGVPTLYIQIINSPLVKKYKLNTIEACISGAAPLPIEVQKKFEELTGGKLREGYGLTETSPVTHVNPILGKFKVGSIGLPVPNTLAAIADPDNNVLLPPDSIGELVISGPQVMKGYYNMPEENAKAFFELGGFRWFRTGDIAKMDEEGYFYIVERKKDLIKYKGYSVYPREVEEVLYKHPAVKEAAVIGVPDPEVGEQIKAFVVLKDEFKGKVKEEEIIEFVKTQIAPYKYPRIVEFRDSLPKSAVGKILRKVLRDEEIKKIIKK
jgi:long-chain acyl-CoA synthetase